MPDSAVNHDFGGHSGCRTESGWKRTLLANSPLDQAVPLNFGALHDAEVSHFLSIPNEFDLYSVTLEQGETLDASVSAQAAGSGLASLLCVFNSIGTPLCSTTSRGATRS